ncbi:hypothetical protein FRC09_019844 [Ceratobasidium sp. 395]|nr:hypothetical protein FRC09_019844 [Ceratobasidium sp. 395]
MDPNPYKIRRAQETHTAVRGRRTCDCNRCHKLKITKEWHYKTGENAPLDPPVAPPAPALSSPARSVLEPIENSPALSETRTIAESLRPSPASESSRSWQSLEPRELLTLSRAESFSLSSVTSAHEAYPVISRAPSLAGSDSSSVRILSEPGSGSQRRGDTAPPNSPVLPANYLDNLSPRFLLSVRNPGIRLMSTPRSLTPGDCNMDAPLPDNFASMDHSEEFFLEADYVLTPPTSPASAASEYLAHFLDDEAEQRYWDDFLEAEDYLPPPAHLNLDAEVFDGNNEGHDEDYDDDDNAYRGIEFQPDPDASESEREPDPDPESEPEARTPSPGALDDNRDNDPDDDDDPDNPDDPNDEEVAPAFLRHPDIRNFFI